MQVWLVHVVWMGLQAPGGGYSGEAAPAGASAAQLNQQEQEKASDALSLISTPVAITISIKSV